MECLSGRIGILSDAHGNIEALAKGIGVLRRGQVNRLFHLGDAVGYLPGLGAWTMLIEEGVACLKGNHEAMLLGEVPVDERRDRSYRLEETRRLLDPTVAEVMRDVPTELSFRVDDRVVLFVHGTPDGPLDDYLYPDTPLERIRRSDFDVCFMGHTHRPCDRSWGGRRFVNVGSCGQPRDHGTLGSVCVFDTEADTIELLRFDIHEETVAAIARVGGADPVVSAMLNRRPAVQLVGKVVDD